MDEIIETLESLNDDFAAQGAHEAAFASLADTCEALRAYSLLRGRAVRYRLDGSIGRAEQAEHAADEALAALRRNDICAAVAYLRSEGLKVRLEP